MTDFEFDEPKGKGTNRTGKVTDCMLCKGDRFVTVRLRTPKQSTWMEAHGLVPSTRSSYEEVAPCPDCNPVEVEFYRHDRSKFRSMDPADIRQSLSL